MFDKLIVNNQDLLKKVYKLLKGMTDSEVCNDAIFDPATSPYEIDSFENLNPFDTFKT